MPKIYAQQKRPAAKPAAPSHTAPASHTPSLVSGAGSSDLDSMMQAKFQQHFLDNQIPTAEAEADRIAASVSGARTPDEVKSQLGEKMGADFSNVTFHTDSAARGMADTMGARAYTTGNDVYFGSGGFDAGVAAHELVHTVQQGVVGSSMQTSSAPTGGVQMMPRALKSIGHGIKSAGKSIASVAKFPFWLIGGLISSKAERDIQEQAASDTLMAPSRKHLLHRHAAVKVAQRERRNHAYDEHYNLLKGIEGKDFDKAIARKQASEYAKKKSRLTRNPFKRHSQVEDLLTEYMCHQQDRRDEDASQQSWIEGKWKDASGAWLH